MEPTSRPQRVVSPIKDVPPNVFGELLFVHHVVGSERRLVHDLHPEARQILFELLNDNPYFRSLESALQEVFDGRNRRSRRADCSRCGTYKRFRMDRISSAVCEKHLMFAPAWYKRSSISRAGAARLSPAYPSAYIRTDVSRYTEVFRNFCTARDGSGRKIAVARMSPLIIVSR